MAVPLVAKIAVPYARLELPGWGRVLRAAGVYQEDGWSGAPTRVIRGKLHGYTMRLSLANWSERQTYFLGRYYDLHTQAFAMTCVRPGDTFIDVGGNSGMITLLAARLVGEGGHVHTFEPNPVEGDRIRAALDENGIPNVTLHRMGLADARAELTLSVVSHHSGLGTFAEVLPWEAKYVSAKHVAKVARGDDVLPPNLNGAVTIKVDVEGYECRVLRGLHGTLTKYRPAVVAEASDAHLRRAGQSAKELLDLMADLGYRAYRTAIRRRLGRQRLSFAPIHKGDASLPRNVAWLYPGTIQEDRARPYMDA
ncbi:MAG: FkbM family methyltransferase [Planctomycetota bacterium]|nr:FkbM family methyltransferase [Planctomycetota bacterium]